MDLGLHLTTLDWIVCLAALAGSIGAGLYLAMLAKSSANSANFFLAGRKLTWPIVGASLFATNIGAEHLVGLSGDAYRYGLRAGTVELSTAICLGFTIAVLLPYYMRNKVYTIPEFLEIRYSPNARIFFSGLMLIICIMTKMAFTLFAGAIVLKNLLGWDVMATVWVLAALVAVVTMLGGFAVVAYTDTIQTVIMIVGCTIMLVIGLYNVGGWNGLESTLASIDQDAFANIVHDRADYYSGPRDWMHVAGPYDDANYPFWGILAGALYGGIFYWGMDQVNVQRMLGARDLRQARLGALFAILLKLTPIFIFALPGVIAFALYPDALQGEQTKETFVLLLNRMLPSGIRGLVLSALLAALISSLLAVMNSTSTMVVRDFCLRFQPDLSERTQVRLGRLSIIGAMILGVGAAYLVYKTPDGLYKYLQTISIYLVMPVTPAIAFGILSRRVNMSGAVASVLTGIALASIFVADQIMGAEAGARVFPWLHHTLTLNYTYRGLWGTLVITLVLFIVSLMTRPSPVERLINTTIDWNGKIQPFQGPRDWRLLLASLLLVTFMLYWWLW